MNFETFARAIDVADAELAVPQLCVRTLTGIVTGSFPLRAVRHPLGFLCLPVVRQGEWGVCVHVWTATMPQAASTTSAVHCHSWDLVSFVLYGQVGNVSMDVVDDPRSATHRVFEVHSLDDGDEMRATGRLVRCTERDRQVADAGSVYRLGAGEFHESVLGDNPEAATVVLGRGRSAPDLSLGPPETPTHRITRQRCDARETAEAARIVINRLANTVSV
jgi:hypothetical protein